MRLSALAVAVVAAACSVDHPSEELACDGPNDCQAPRSCVDGYCVEVVTQCPQACTSCDIPGNRCTIDRSGGGNGGVTCPAGWNCVVSCGVEACQNVDCDAALSCQITCSGENACANVTCGTGMCQVTCAGQNACRQVDCRNACACDVTCSDGTSCDMPSRCPSQPCEMGDGCTSQPASCGGC